LVLHGNEAGPFLSSQEVVQHPCIQNQMFGTANLHKSESGQTALETAIILIAFVVVASVFAFTILSAGTSSTEAGEEAIYAGLEGVQSSLNIRGAVIAEASGTTVDTVVFTVALVSGGEPLDMTDTSGDNVVVIGYRDIDDFANAVDWTVDWVVDNDGGTPDTMLEDGELAEVTVDLAGAVTATTITSAPGANEEFTLEIKPPLGGVLNITRDTPAAIEAVMELR
jgi:flagellin FlaB